MRPVKMVWLAMVVSMASATGCAIRTQAPIKEVAYDFSDADFYDRAYAPSPDYGPRGPELDHPPGRVAGAGAPDQAILDVGALPPGEAVEWGPRTR